MLLSWTSSTEAEPLRRRPHGFLPLFAITSSAGAGSGSLNASFSVSLLLLDPSALPGRPDSCALGDEVPKERSAEGDHSLKAMERRVVGEACDEKRKIQNDFFCETKG